MRTRIRTLLTASVMALSVVSASAPTQAQITVWDPTNYTQNVLQAARSLQQVTNQITSLQNEAQMLMNQARNLASLPSSVVNQLRANLATTERLIAQARGLAYDVTNLDREFARLYPEHERRALLLHELVARELDAALGRLEPPGAEAVVRDGAPADVLAREVPDRFSVRITSHPAARRAVSCTERSWSVVLTRA